MPSNFPVSVDALNNVITDDTDEPGIHAPHHNDLASAVMAVERIIVGPTHYNAKGFNVTGASLKGDGTLEVDATVQAFMTLAAGGIAEFPPGTYLIDPGVLVFPIARTTRIRGAGKGITILKSNGPSATVLSGAQSHLVSEFHCGLEGLTLNGGGGTGPICSLQDMGLFAMRDIIVTNGAGVGLKLTSIYDSQFENVYIETCGSGTSGCLVLDSVGSGVDAMNNCQFFNVHIEPGAIDTILLDLVGNATNAVDAMSFYGLKVHGDLATGLPNQPLIRISQYAQGATFFNPIIAFGKGTAQVICDAPRTNFIAPHHGIAVGLVPTYAYQFTSNASNCQVWVPNFTTNSYTTAFMRCEPGCIHNKLLFPVASGQTMTKFLSDAGRSMAIYDDASDGGGLRIYNSDQLNVRSKIITEASYAVEAGLNLPLGVVPTTPVDGDMWYDGTNFKARVGGVTKTFTLV